MKIQGRFLPEEARKFAKSFSELSVAKDITFLWKPVNERSVVFVVLTSGGVLVPKQLQEAFTDGPLKEWHSRFADVHEIPIQSRDKSEMAKGELR